MLRKKSVSSNNWRKLNSWTFVRELAPVVLDVNQEEADNLLHPELVAVKTYVVQDISPTAGVCRVADPCRAQVGISPSSEVSPSSPGLSLLNTVHCLVCRVHCLLPDSAARVARESILIRINDLRKTDSVCGCFFKECSRFCEDNILD